MAGWAPLAIWRLMEKITTFFPRGFRGGIVVEWNSLKWNVMYSMSRIIVKMTRVSLGRFSDAPELRTTILGTFYGGLVSKNVFARNSFPLQGILVRS